LREGVERAASVTAKLTDPMLDKTSALINAHDYMTLLGHTGDRVRWRSAVGSKCRDEVCLLALTCLARAPPTSLSFPPHPSRPPPPSLWVSSDCLDVVALCNGCNKGTRPSAAD
jgi:hypothetical protein